MSERNELFAVVRDDGDWVDAYGNGGYSVFDTRAEAQDVLDSEADPSAAKIIRFIRDDAGCAAQARKAPEKIAEEEK